MQPNVIKFPNRMAQIQSFQNLKINGYTPSDIDIAYEIGGRTFIFGELKRTGVQVPKGQSLLLRHIFDGLNQAGKNVLVFLAEHDTSPGEDIDVGNLEVKFIRWCRKGRVKSSFTKGHTVQFYCEKFININELHKY